jgi:two-component system, cell cycle response regulator
MSALVLVADSDPFNLRLLSELCSSLGYDVMSAADGGAVLDALARQRPSLVLMDAGLPVMDGLNVLGILKADAGLRDVPVLLVTQEDDTYSRERALALGANHCLLKPFRPLEVQQRLREVIDASDPPSRREGSGRVIVDPLTQLGTVHQLLMSLDYEFTRAVRYKHALSCVVVACDNGPELHAQLGAAVSQTVVLPIANTIKGGIRTVDHVFRSGELEFTILLPETQEDGASIVVQRLKALLREFHERSLAPRPSLSVAAATLSSRGVNDGEALYAAAKRAVG